MHVYNYIIMNIQSEPILGSANQKIESNKISPRLLQYVGCAEVFLKPP